MTAPHGLTQTIAEGRSLTIGENVEVWVVAARGGSAKLVINAPRDVTITRNPKDDPHTTD